MAEVATSHVVSAAPVQNPSDASPGDAVVRGALQCPVCGLGPITIGGCSDLLSHHDEQRRDGNRTNNSCPRCGFFASNRAGWRPWEERQDVNREDTAAGGIDIAANMETRRAQMETHGEWMRARMRRFVELLGYDEMRMERMTGRRRRRAEGLSLTQPWIDPTFIDGEGLVCNLCFGVNLTPATGCRVGHVYCTPCYNKVLEMPRPQCPECREAVTQLHGNRSLHEEEARRGARCGYCSEWQGTAWELSTHLGDCAAAPAECPHKNHGCHVEVPRRALDAHAAACGFRPYPCGACRREMPANSHAAHAAECRRAMVQCSLPRCIERVAREDLPRHEAACQWKEVACPVGCSAQLPRCEMREHVVEHGEDGARALFDQMVQAEVKRSRVQAEVQRSQVQSRYNRCRGCGERHPELAPAAPCGHRRVCPACSELEQGRPCLDCMEPAECR